MSLKALRKRLNYCRSHRGRRAIADEQIRDFFNPREAEAAIEDGVLRVIQEQCDDPSVGVDAAEGKDSTTMYDIQERYVADDCGVWVALEMEE